MIKKLNEDAALKFKNISPEEKEKKGILGRLYGNVASFAAPTRNGRKYDQSLWEKLFDSDLIKERFANGGIFGELCHPDYEEVALDKVAIVMPEPPVKDNKGNLVAYVDIVDTPCGRVAYQLAKYGYNFGISSRGTGDIIYDDLGEELVDPDTYQLNAFDLVEIPAVESARLAFVESLDTKKKYGKTLKQKLSEEIEKASDSDKKVMTEALENLNIQLDEKLVKPSKEDIDSVKDRLYILGFDVVGEGETLFGNTHLQLKLKGTNHNGEDLKRLADSLSDLSDEFYEKGLPITYNIGLDNNFDITCGLDIRDKSVKDVDEQFYLNRDKEKDAVDALKTKIDPAKLRDDALSLLKHSDLEALCRKYDVTTDALGKEKLGVNILTPDEMETKFGVRSLNDIKEELQNEEGWGDYINDESEYLFNELESLMYEIRNYEW